MRSSSGLHQSPADVQQTLQADFRRSLAGPAESERATFRPPRSPQVRGGVRGKSVSELSTAYIKKSGSEIRRLRRSPADVRQSPAAVRSDSTGFLRPRLIMPKLRWSLVEPTPRRIIFEISRVLSFAEELRRSQLCGGIFMNLTGKLRLDSGGV